MTNKEFSDNFATLLNSYFVGALYGEPSSKGEIVLDEYEKSYFLTEAQEQLVIALYNGQGIGGSFEETEELRRYLAPLVKDATKEPYEVTGKYHIAPDSVFFQLPPDLWFITYESVGISEGGGDCDSHTSLDIVPVTQDEYHKIKKNPFRGPSSRRALRLDLSDNIVEIVSKYRISTYYVRYLKKPRPIILEKLPEGLMIGEESGYSECELPEILHQRILDLAVNNALRHKGIVSSDKKK
jgi:hypothetical protein